MQNVPGAINCVRWNPKGTILASVADDATVAATDFRTEKTIYSHTNSEGGYYCNNFHSSEIY